MSIRSSAAPRPRNLDGRKPWRRPNFWALAGIPAVLFLTVAFLIPLGAIVAKSVTGETPWQFYVDLFQEPIYQRQFLRTILVSAAVTVICVLIGYPYAYVMARSGPRLQSILGGVLLVS